VKTNTANILEIPKQRGKYGEGSIRQLAEDRWMISFYDREGRRRRKSYKTEAKARAALATATTLREAGKLDPHDAKVKVDALAESYKTYAANSAPKSYDWVELVWRVHLEPFFGGMLATRVTTDLVQEYIAERLKAGAKTSTVNREVAVLRAMFYLGAKSDPPKVLRVPRFPDKLREPNPRAGFVTEDQYAALQAKCKHGWLRALLALGYNYGFRKGELLGLRVSQIDLKARDIRLLPGTTKNDKGRTVKMTNEVYQLLAECVRGKGPEDAVFTWGNGRPVLDFRGAWRTLRESAGLPRLRVHDLRRSAVRRMVRRGISKHVAKKISGHVTDSVFDRYDIVDEQDLADAARKLESAPATPDNDKQ
jgi:integrase